MPKAINGYELSVINAIVGMSVSKTYSQAKTEWNFTGDCVDHGAVKDQKPVAKCNLCDHPIRYGYILKNSKNNRKIEVGSECVDNFMNITVTVQNKMDIAKKNATKKVKEAIHKTELAALYEASRVGDAVKKGKNWKDIDYVGSTGNNTTVLYKYIKDGRLFEMANKYNVKLNMDRINAFVNTYKK